MSASESTLTNEPQSHQETFAYYFLCFLHNRNGEKRGIANLSSKQPP
jgi:hypothetical protein